MGSNPPRGMESDSFFLDGYDVEEVRRAMERKVDEIRRKGGVIENQAFNVTQAGDQPFAEARFDYHLPAAEIGDEVEYETNDPATGG